jgi:hypothetical protein
MLQVLNLDVSKVDRDVAHVIMMFQLYVSNVSSVLDVRGKGFISDVTKVDLVFEWCSETHLPQPHAAVTGPVCMRVGAEGRER